MPATKLLLLAVSKMRGGLCAAGFTTEADGVTGLRWARPVREHDNLLPGDLSDADGRLFRCCDVIEIDLRAPRPDPPHVEDCLCDFTHRPPRLLYHVGGDKRATFLERHLDPHPEDALVEHRRTLCLARPEVMGADFSLDAYSGKYEARLRLRLPGISTPRLDDPRGLAVTDLGWRALGRSWLGDGGQISLDEPELRQRLGLEALYVTFGLSRAYQGEFWPLVVGVHTVPELAVEADVEQL